MTTTPLTADQLRDQIAAAFERMDAHQWGYDHGFCGSYGVDPETDSFVDAALATVQPELDRMAAELDRVRAELAATQGACQNLDRVCGTGARAAAFREAARVLEDTGHDDDAVNLLDNIADGITTPAARPGA